MDENSKLNILHVNTLDIEGGAARAVHRLHKALLHQNINSQILVQNKSSDDFRVLSEDSKIRKIFNKVRPHLDSIPIRFYKNRTKNLFSPSWLPFSNIVDKINELNPDIVHLHWICNGMMKIEDIAKIQVPIVWTLHDNWAFTGGCHIMRECDKYKYGCGSCPQLNSDKINDLSKSIFKRKQLSFSQINNLSIVGVSQWLTDRSKNSFLLNNKKHLCIANPLNTNIFKEFNKNISRELWSLPKDKRLVLFGANSATSDINKGFKELSEALNKLTHTDVEFVVFGSSKPKLAQNFGFKTHYLGHLHDDVSLVTLYSAVDVMIVPSLQEAFGQTASEAMSCATPVVAFASTGLLDIIDHKLNGYLAKPFDTDDLAYGIEWILNNENYEELCQNSRKKVLKEFDSVVVSQKYIKLYEEVLNDC